MAMSRLNNFILFCFVLQVVACTTSRNPCLEPKVPKLKVSCYQIKDANKVDTLLPNAIFVSLDIDSAKYWYWGAKSISKFDLILSPLHDTSKWILQVDSAYSPIDTLTIIYTPRLKFFSNACGYGHEYVLQQVLSTHNNIDSIQLTNSEITTKAIGENVKIYF